MMISQFELKLIPSTSGIHFSINHLGISDIYGNFTDFDTEITTSSDNFLDAKITFSAKTNTINTHIDARDNHLKSADFLDAVQFPEMKFISTSIKKGKKGNFIITGDFTLHGVTKTIDIQAILVGKAIDPSDNSELYGLKFNGTINRLDYGVGSKYPTKMLSDEVKFEANLEFKKTLN